ncbi:hypothetical protein [Rickettsia hoogstraalii]|uniref:hypothetical protein n=1 Tax=Rickettsia hoogstraalii TaxID=467174 RepID=UPI0012E08EC6|nr:hypothetical protein [Rickettsia hoogstraalii]
MKNVSRAVIARKNCKFCTYAISGYLTRLPRSLRRHCCVDTDVIPAEAGMTLRIRE